MARPETSGPGRVSSTPERPPPRARYDVVVLGAGLLGTVVAARLRRSVPERSLLLVEADGLPNEGGATVASPGLLPPVESGGAVAPYDAFGRPTNVRGGAPQAAPEAGPDALTWARAWSLSALAGLRSPPTAGSGGWLALAPGPRAGAAPAGTAPLQALLGPAVLGAVRALTGVEGDRPARLLDGGYLSTDALVTALARRAVTSGADLLLNTRARPRGAGRILLERLSVDRRMRVGVHACQTVEAGAVVVACGAAGASVAEEGLDRPVGLRNAYLQFPRLRLPPSAQHVGLPVVAFGGWAVRPAPAGALLVPPALPPDPEGYEPVPGRLLGVPVGLRRELIDRLLAAPALASLVSSGGLELGKSVRTVRGGRFTVPPRGVPVAERLAPGWWLLAGGTLGLAHDVAAAAAVAADVAGVSPPWRG